MILYTRHKAEKQRKQRSKEVKRKLKLKLKKTRSTYNIILDVVNGHRAERWLWKSSWSEKTHITPPRKKKTRAIKSNNHESITYNVLLLTYYTLHSRCDERPPRGAEVYRMVCYKRVYRHKSTCSFVRSFNETTY